MTDVIPELVRIASAIWVTLTGSATVMLPPLELAKVNELKLPVNCAANVCQAVKIVEAGADHWVNV